MRMQIARFTLKIHEFQIIERKLLGPRQLVNLRGLVIKGVMSCISDHRGNETFKYLIRV